MVADSPAAAAGIVEGDELTSVDGQDARGMRLSAIRSRLRASATPSVSLGILHAGHADVRVLRLRDLL